MQRGRRWCVAVDGGLYIDKRRASTRAALLDGVARHSRPLTHPNEQSVDERVVNEWSVDG